MAPKAPPGPPRLVGDVDRDATSMRHWNNAFFQNLVNESRLGDPSRQFAPNTFDADNLPDPTDPASTSIADAQQTANEAYNHSVTTLTAVQAALDLKAPLNSPTFTGTVSISQALAVTGDITPSQITSNQNDYTPTGNQTATVWRISSDAQRIITGIGNGSDGRIIHLLNVGNNNIVLADESSSSAAENRFALPDALIVRPDSGVSLIYDATSLRWRMLVPGTHRERLLAARTYYVRTDGADTNTGLANTSGGAFRTIQHAVDVVFALDANSFLITIQVGAGTYTDGTVQLWTPPGAYPTSALGFGLNLIGDTSTPSNVVVDGGVQVIGPGAQWFVSGFKFNQHGSHPYLAWGHAGGWLRLGKIEFGTTTSYQVVADYQSVVEFMDDYTISGSAQFHAVANYGSMILALTGVTCTLSGSPDFSVAFVYAAYLSQQIWNGAAFSGAATGQRYFLRSNSVADTNGGGANFFPGDVAGVAETGAQYI